MEPKQNKAQLGFSLAEVMVTTLILAIVLTGALSMFIYCSLLSENAGNLSLSMGEAQSKLEEIRDSSFSSISSTYHGTTFNLTKPEGATGNITVAEVGSDVAADLLQVSITVNWTNRNNRALSSSLSTLVARH